MNQDLKNKLMDISKEIMDKDLMYHDFAHARNVMKNGEKLLKKLGGDEDIVITACLLHDIARDKDNHEELGAEMAREILVNLPKFPQEKVEAVVMAIQRHKENQVTHEEKILSDADKMAAFGELSIARGLMMSAKQGKSLKEGIEGCINLLDDWYPLLHFDISKKMVKRDYKKSKKILNQMLKQYS